MKVDLSQLKIFLSIAVLAIYVIYFLATLVPWVLTLLGQGQQMLGDETDVFGVYLWTGVSVMIVSVVSVAFGQPAPSRTSTRLSPETIIAYYAWTYSLLGLVALVLVALRPETAPPLIKNAATTFFGILIPVVNSFLNPAGAPERS